jgi:hypothetical protein
MKVCAEVCRRCAQSCRDMANHVHDARMAAE